MGFGISGHRCEDCNIEWNGQWSTTTGQFPDYECPKCGTFNISFLKHTVPFAMAGSDPNLYECICGCKFYRKLDNFFFFKDFDFEKDKEKLKVVCPSCNRTNIPPDKQPWFDVPITIYEHGEG
jgi:ssDNA-binding Zn-finger/Zn-ribbon topoisomerase 1